jgi:RecB family exonuclease
MNRVAQPRTVAPGQGGSIACAPSYAALEDALAEALRDARGRSDGNVWVLVPTNLTALHLKRRLARSLGGMLGPRFLTLKDAAREVSLLRLAGRGARPMPPGAAQLVVERLLNEAPPGSYFAGFARFSNAPAALGQVIRTLEDCLWTPEALKAAAPGTAGPDPAAPRRLAELADVWARLRAWKDEKRLFDDADLMREAATAGRGEGPPLGQFIVYGFYDLGPAQRALVALLARRAEHRAAFLLWQEEDGRPAPGYEYAAPTVEWLKRLLNVERVTEVGPGAAGSDLERARAGLFSNKELPAPEEAQRRLRELTVAFDGTLRMVNCTGRAAQAEEAAREVLRAAREGAGDAAILVRGAEEAGLQTEALERAGVRAYVREGLPLRESAAGRVALSLLELAGGDAERAAVLDFLALARVDWPEGLSASALDRVSRLAGVVRGREPWREKLRRQAAQLSSDAQRAEEEPEREACARDAELCRTAAGFMDEFLASAAELDDSGTWSELAARLGALADRYAPEDDPARGDVLDLIEGIGRLDATGLPPERERALRLLGGLLSEQSRRRERFQHVGVTVSTIMGARGVTFDTVVVPGLAEKEFPRRAAPHALLTELDKEALNGAAERLGCGRLPLQKDRPAEERYLLRNAFASARKGLVLAWPRMEQDTGRPRVVSRFVVEACSALLGWTVPAGAIEDGLPAGLVRRVPLNRSAPGVRSPGELELALDELEYDAAVFVGQAGLRVGYLSAVSDTFGRAMAMDRARWGSRTFGPCDGKVRADDLLAALRERYSRFDTPISPSRLEAYAQCPFGYFLAHVLGVEELEAPTEEFQLPPLERGLLVHDLLRRVYERHAAGRRLGELTAEEVELITQRAGETLDGLGRVHAENHPATWQAERERTGEELRQLLLHEAREHGTACPEHFEYEFGEVGPAPFVLRLSDEAGVAFRGRIDRVDRLPDGAVQIVDYKTGRPDRYRKASFLGGLQLQLPVYLLAVAELMEARSGSGLYLMVAGPRDVPQFTLEDMKARMGDFKRALTLILEGIAAGDFFPLPAEARPAREHCERYCRFRAACGAARQALWEQKAGDPEAGRLGELRAIE